MADVTDINEGRGKRGRGPGRPFQPGQSGNPAGRRPDGALRELARAHTEEAVATLASIMADAGAPPSARVQAAQALLDRGWGRAPQSLEVTGAEGGPVKVLTWAETLAAAADAVRQSGE